LCEIPGFCLVDVQPRTCTCLCEIQSSVASIAPCSFVCYSWNE
jgi:hypothetical protein